MGKKNDPPAQTAPQTAHDPEVGVGHTNPLYSGMDVPTMHENPLYDRVPEQTEHNPLEDMLDALSSSKKSGLRNKITGSAPDSDKFQSIVNTLSEITMCWDGSLTGDKDNDFALISYAQTKYERLLNACDEYLDRRLVVTSAGKQRQNIVRQVREFAARDMEALTGAASKALSGGNAQIHTVRDLLAQGRMLQFTVADINAEVGGANASVVHKLQHGGNDYYFKKEENVVARTTVVNKFADAGNEQDYISTAFDDEYNSIPDDPGHQIIRQHLMDIRPAMLTDFYAEKPRNAKDENSWIMCLDNMFQKVRKPKPPQAEYQEVMTIFKRMGKAISSSYETASALRDIGIVQTDEQTEYNVSKRNVATSRMAELLGVGHLIAHSETAEVTDQKTGQKFRGNLMAEAEGEELEQALTTALANSTSGADAASGSLQHSMICLEMLDNICGQVDRHSKNMLYQFDAQGKMSGIQGIDNDLAFGEMDQIVGDYDRQNFQPAFRSTGAGDEMAIPFMDKTMADNIIDLAGKPDTVRFVMRDVLRPVEIEALCTRLRKTADVLQAAMQSDQTKNFAQGRRFLEDDEWDAHRDDIHSTLMAKRDSKESRTYYSEFMYGLDAERVSRSHR